MKNNVELIYSLAGLGVGQARHLSDVDFHRVNFDRLLVGPGSPPDALVYVTRCSFRECSVDGEFRIAPGVVLQDVIFESVSSPDSLIINTQAQLNNVVVRGCPKTGGLWVKPADFSDTERGNVLRKWADSVVDEAEIMLDFSQFYSEEVEVVGLPLSKLKWDPHRHVPVSLAWRESEDWRRLNFSLTSYWSLRMKRLQVFNASEGVFSLPSPKSKNYAKTMDEMDRLMHFGFLETV